MADESNRQYKVQGTVKTTNNESTDLKEIVLAQEELALVFITLM